MVDRGFLQDGGRARCGFCRNHYVKRTPRTRAEGKAEGWRYLEPWAWICSTCAHGHVGLWTRRKKKRAKPRHIVRRPLPKAPERPQVVRGGGGWLKSTREILEELGAEPNGD